MSRRSTQLALRKQPDPNADDMVFRSAALRIDANAAPEDRSVPLILATETPVDVYDRSTRSVIKEVAVMSGGQWPKQLPLTNRHMPDSTDAQVGSIRDLAITDEGLAGRAHFSSKPRGTDALTDVREGHVTDISIGFKRLEVRNLKAGETATIRGKSYTGPVRLVTRWRAFEGAMAPTGADSNSRFLPAMRAYTDPQGCREDAMNEQFRSLLESKGMPAGLSDEDALRWANENFHTQPAQAAAAATATAAPAASSPPATAPAPPAVDADALRREAAEAERNRVIEIQAACRTAVLNDRQAVADDLIRRGVPGSEACREILRLQGEQSQTGPNASNGVAANNGAAGGPNATGDGTTALRTALSHAVCLRAFGDGWRPDDQPDTWRPSADAQRFRHARLTDIARRFMDHFHEPHHHMSDIQVAMRALGMGTHDPQVALRAGDTPFYNVSGMFTHVTLDVAHNSLRRSYTEARTQFARWAKRGPNVMDFKNQNRSLLGEVSDPDVLPENQPIKETTYSDAHEAYKVEMYASIFSISFQAIANNQLNAFTDAPAKVGNSFKRKMNRLVVAQLLENAALQIDGVALFHSSHANLGSAGAPSRTTLNEMWKLMAKQTGLNSTAILGIMPRFILAPPDIAGPLYELVGSPSIAIATEGNSGTLNIYGPNGPRQLEVIEEPQLSHTGNTGYDVDAWFALADPAEIDTIEYAYLDGFETPQVMSEAGFDRVGVRFRVLTGFAAKAIDFRGMFKNPGAT